MSSSLTDVPTILTVDDSEIVQKLIARYLGSDYRVLEASNAVDALALIYHEPINLVLLDVSMPGIDGLELCRTIRSIPQFQHLAIIMVTARDSPFDKVQGRLAGATDYLTKPFEAEQLRSVVGKFTQPQRTAAEGLDS